MPMYTYHCRGCDNKWDELRDMNQMYRIGACPECHSMNTQKIVTLPPKLKFEEGFPGEDLKIEREIKRGIHRDIETE